MLVNDHAIIAPCRFERNVPGAHIGKHMLRGALQGIPKSTATTHFDQKAIAGFERDVSGSFARR